MNFNFNSLFQAFRPAEPQNASRSPKSASVSQLGYFNGQAIVEQPIQPDKPGRVRFKGSRWTARCDQPIAIAPGEVVDVIGVQHLTLRVEPAFLLSASKIGLAKVRQALEQQGRMQPPLERTSDTGTAPITVLPNPTGESEPIAAETWKRFSQGKPVYIATFKACCEALGLNWKEIVGYGVKVNEPSAPPADSADAQALELEPNPDLNFVGRTGAIGDLDRLVHSGARAIAILGEGGMGKTSLARQYFSQAGFDRILECWMAKQTQNVISAESVVQGWLQQHFDEEPAREFQAALAQLRQHLQASSHNGTPTRIGVLIDNLEPALDRQGHLIETHRGYAALLEMLADPTVQSLTLITSREPLHDPSLTVQPYVLSGLEPAAWRQFFAIRQLQIEPDVLSQMHQAYGGNPKAMTILSSAISVDFNGDMAAFWQEQQTNLLGAADLQSLISSHFDRLQQVYPEAYRLLCRLGCYRFQDNARLPLEGLFCLLWDVPESQHCSIVRFLRDLFLIERFDDDGYRLHPLIQAKALEMLKASPDWQTANRQAAEFWSGQVNTIDSVEDALLAFEAYYHYLQIDDFAAAAAVILQGRDNRWQKAEPLGISFYRLGLLRRMISSITRVIDHIQPGYSLSKLYNILGDLYWLKGEIYQAIACHEKSREVAIAHHHRDLEIVSLFNIGLCRIALWEIEEATRLFTGINSLAENTEWHIYAVGSWFCLAFLHSQLGHKSEALNLVKKVSNEYAKLSTSSWSRGYSLLFMGWALRNLGDLERAARLYHLAKDYAEQSGYTQVLAGALNGLAAICRDQQEFKGAIANHLAAIRLLDRIEARGDLAEAHYQLGLTYQTMNELNESRLHFQTAIALFQQMNAPNQVERVQRSLESSP